jgi:hypothetical protein
MNTPARIIVIILAAILLVGLGFAIASLVQDNGANEKEIGFTLLIRTPGDFAITMGPINPATGDVEVEVTKGEPAVFTITTTAADGWDSPINLSIDGLPEGTVYAFGVNPMPPTGTTTLTIQTGNLQSNSGYVCVLTAIGD